MEQFDENIDWENRRASRRMRTLKHGQIVVQGGYSVFDCVVRNVSLGGAMLQVEALGVPTHFELKFDTAASRHACTVRWRAESAVGVSFDDVAHAA